MDIMNWLGALPGAGAQGIIWGLMAIGVFVTYKVLDFADLTVDGSMVTGAAVCAVLMTAGVNVWIALLVAMIAGMVAGFITGIFHTVLGIPAILAGILTQLMLWSINLTIMGRANIALPSRQLNLLLDSKEVYTALAILAVFSAVLIVALYSFFGTETGAALRATGNNQNMSRAQGINTKAVQVLGLVISNGIVALSGALLAQYQGFADINMGRGAIVIGLAAVIIGESLISHRTAGYIVRLITVIIGGIIYFVVYQTVIFLGLDANLLKMLSALVVAVFLGFPYVKKTYFKKKTVTGGKKNA
jgi:putative ABC transport system permease protein